MGTEFRQPRQREERKHRLNNEITAPELRVTGPNGEALGIMSLYEAVEKAQELDVDLVEVVPNAAPPVARLIDYGKFKFQEQKKAAEAKSRQQVVEIKEIKFRPSTDNADYSIKLRNIRRFIADGDKCKITLRFRGRELSHQEFGVQLLGRLRDDLGDSIIVESFPQLEGRQMVMMVAPGKKAGGKPKNNAAPSSGETNTAANAGASSGIDPEKKPAP